MKVAIFDFDGTLFPIDTLSYLLSCWKAKGLPKYKYYRAYIYLIGFFIIYKIGMTLRIPSQGARNRALQSFNNIFKGMNEEEIIDYFNNCAEGIIELLNPVVVEEARKAKREGYHLILLSGTYELLLHRVADYLEIDTLIATKMYFNNGLFDPYMKLDVISGLKKTEYLNRYFEDTQVDLGLSIAFADSYSDIHILKLVGKAVVVNPDEKLRKFAIKNNWKIIS